MAFNIPYSPNYVRDCIDKTAVDGIGRIVHHRIETQFDVEGSFCSLGTFIGALGLGSWPAMNYWRSSVTFWENDLFVEQDDYSFWGWIK